MKKTCGMFLIFALGAAMAAFITAVILKAVRILRIERGYIDLDDLDLDDLGDDFDFDGDDLTLGEALAAENSPNNANS